MTTETTEAAANTATIPSDDCAVKVIKNGVEGEIFPHTGQSITIRTDVRPTLGDVRFVHNLRRLQVEADAIEVNLKRNPDESDADHAARVATARDDAYAVLLMAQVDGAIAIVQKSLIAWDWTDQFGKPLPPPSDVAAYDQIQLVEVMYLVAATRGNNEAATGKDSSA
jgi:hypothetical protein